MADELTSFELIANGGANSSGFGVDSLKFDREPIGGLVLVVEHADKSILLDHNQVQVTVIVEIANGGPTPRVFLTEPCAACFHCDISKTPPPAIRLISQ